MHHERFLLLSSATLVLLSLILATSSFMYAAPKAPNKIISRDITVVAWVDGSLIPLPPGASKELVLMLQDPLACLSVVGAWYEGLRVLIDTDIDKQFANAFLLRNSANNRPAKRIDPSLLEKVGDFRLLNRLNVKMSTRDNGVDSVMIQSASTTVV
jgi:hypothetical protein